MGSIAEEIEVAAPAAVVWALAGDIGGIDAWVVSVDAVTVLDGDRRQVTLAGGRGEVIERITSRSEEGMALEYVIEEAPAPLSSYRSRLSVEPNGDGSRVRWSAEVECLDGTDEEAVAAGLESTYANSLASLRQLAESGSGS